MTYLDGHVGAISNLAAILESPLREILRSTKLRQ
jgi:hypothetical protein